MLRARWTLRSLEDLFRSISMGIAVYLGKWRVEHLKIPSYVSMEIHLRHRESRVR